MIEAVKRLALLRKLTIETDIPLMSSFRHLLLLTNVDISAHTLEHIL